MTRAFLGLGSNLGDRWRILREALESLGPAVVQCSQVYETDPVGGPRGQGPYLNLVAEIETDLSPRDLLGVCHRLESAAGRVRTERWGPRTLDIDILWMDGITVDSPDLTIPHPRMWERRFVVAPLAELAPELLPPGAEDHAEGRVSVVGRL